MMRQSGKSRTFELTDEDRRFVEEVRRERREAPPVEPGPRSRLPDRFTTPIFVDGEGNPTPYLGYEARARGAMVGLAVGDALGTTLEFSRPQAPKFPELATGPHRDIVGGGPFHVAPGQVTDDTHMATCLATSLMAKQGFDVDDVAARYVAWTKHAFDIGNQTAAALRAWGPGKSPIACGRAVWEAQGRQPAGNGSLMRTAPIGRFNWDSPGERRRASMLDSAITHFDPRCQLACAVFNTAVATAITDNGSGSAIYLAVLNEIKAATNQLATDYPDLQTEIAKAHDAIAEDVELAGKDDPQLYGPELHLHQQAGFVRVAFRLAFWELFHAPTIAEALIDVANRGGDADTNAAITGALCGAVAAEDEIPDNWRRRVLDALQNDPSHPLASVYHPRVLTDFVAWMKARVLARRDGAYLW